MTNKTKIESGLDRSLIGSLKTVEQFGDVLGRCESILKKLGKGEERLTGSVKELRDLRTELEKAHGREDVTPDSKLEKLKEVLSAWLEMYEVISQAVDKNDEENDGISLDEDLLNGLRGKFTARLSEVRDSHEGKAELPVIDEEKSFEIPPIPESVPPPIPVSEPVSDIPSFDEIADLVFSREESLRLNPSGDKKDLSSIDQDIVKNIQTRLEKNNQFFNDWLRKNFNSDDKVVKDNFLLMIDKTDPLFKRAYDEVPKARLFVDKWFGEKFNEIKLQVSGDAVLSKSKKLKKEKVSGVVVATTTRQGSSLWGKISSLFDKKSNGREESTSFEDIVSDVEKYLDDEFSDRDEDFNFVVSENLINYFKLSNGKKEFIKEIKNNVKYKILKESYPNKWKSIAEKWFDDHKNKWKRGEIKFGKEDEKVKPDLESVDSVSSFDETETSTEVEENFDFEVGGRKVEVGDFFKSSDFVNLRVIKIDKDSITVEKFIDSDVGVEEKISKEVWDEDYASSLVLWPEGINLDNANNTESVVEETFIGENVDEEKINLETQAFLESNSEKFINIITDIVQEKEYQQYPHRAFGVFLNEIKQTEEYHKLLSENKYKINEVELIIREWFYEKYQEEKDKLDPESVAKEIIEVNEQKTAEDLKWEEIYQKEREKIEKEINLVIRELNQLRFDLLGAIENYYVKKSISKNKNTFGNSLKKIFGKGVDYAGAQKEAADQMEEVYAEYVSKINKLLILSGTIEGYDESFIKNKIKEEIESVLRSANEMMSEEDRDPREKPFIELALENIKNRITLEFDQEFENEIKSQIEEERNKFLNEVKNRTESELAERKNAEEKAEKIAEFMEMDQVKLFVQNYTSLGFSDAENMARITLSNLLDSNKSEIEIGHYFDGINSTIFGVVAEYMGGKLNSFKDYLEKKVEQKDQQDRYVNEAMKAVYERLGEEISRRLRDDKKGVINFSELTQILDQQVVERYFLDIYRLNNNLPDNVFIWEPGTEMVELGIDSKPSKMNSTGESQSVAEEVAAIEKENSLRLVDSKKIGKKENKYNFFIGQNLRMKNGSPVLVRDIQSDFIVVMEKDGNLISIFDDEINKQLLSTSGLEMSKLSGSESKDKDQWDQLLKSVREKFINKSSGQEVFWEYQDALKQYFEANQDAFEGDYKKFLNQEKQVLGQYGRSGVDSVIRILEESFVSAIKSMDNKAKAEKKRAEEKRNNIVETPVSSKTNKPDKTTQTPTSVGTKTPVISSSPSNTSIRGGGGVVETKSNVEIATRRENNNRNRIEFAGRLYDKKMSVYLDVVDKKAKHVEWGDKKTEIVISGIRDGKISFKAGGINIKMSEEEWLELLEHSKNMREIEQIERENEVLESKSENQEEISFSELFPEDDDLTEEDIEKEKVNNDEVKTKMVVMMKLISGEDWLKQLRDKLVEKIEKVKKIDINFVNSLSSEEKFILSFVNKQCGRNGFLENNKGNGLLSFYAYSNEDNCPLFMMFDSGGKIRCQRHDKPVKNIGGTLVEIDNGEEYTVHCKIFDGKIVLERD